ncbi:MAG: permease [Candidatus Competibacteraceae bacterium]
MQAKPSPFLYDAENSLLLAGMIFAITVLRTFFSAERARQWLSGKHSGIGNILAAALGIVTPFCSCSAVPLFIGFVESGIPLGVTFSFLIAAPVINEVALVLLYGMFGWKVAALYVASGMTMAIITGLFIGRLGVERWVEDFVWQMQFRAGEDDSGKLTWEERFARGRAAVQDIIRKIWLYVLIGIGLGAVIHGYVPADALAAYMGKDAPWWAVPLVVLAALPLYSNAAGMAPILLALVEKGAALGTALAFMMAVVGVSLPETILLRRVLKPQLIALFIGIVTVAIIITGYLFNLIL